MLNYIVRIVVGGNESFLLKNILILDSAANNVIKSISSILITNNSIKKKESFWLQLTSCKGSLIKPKLSIRISKLK